MHFPVDINECEDVPGVCDANANCINTAGSYMCFCSSGYTEDGATCTGEGKYCFSRLSANTWTCGCISGSMSSAHSILAPFCSFSSVLLYSTHMPLTVYFAHVLVNVTIACFIIILCSTH